MRGLGRPDTIDLLAGQDGRFVEVLLEPQILNIAD